MASKSTCMPEPPNTNRPATMLDPPNTKQIIHAHSTDIGWLGFQCYLNVNICKNMALVQVVSSWFNFIYQKGIFGIQILASQ